MPVWPLCAQHSVRLLQGLKIPCPSCDKRRPSGRWYENTDNTNSCKMIKIVIAVNLNIELNEVTVNNFVCVCVCVCVCVPLCSCLTIAVSVQNESG